MFTGFTGISGELDSLTGAKTCGSTWTRLEILWRKHGSSPERVMHPGMSISCAWIKFEETMEVSQPTFFRLSSIMLGSHSIIVPLRPWHHLHVFTSFTFPWCRGSFSDRRLRYIEKTGALNTEGSEGCNISVTFFCVICWCFLCLWAQIEMWHAVWGWAWGSSART